MNDIEAGRRELGMSNRDLWLGYIGVGGNGSMGDLRGWLTGEVEASARDHDMVALALNEVFLDRGLDHPVRYSDESGRSSATPGPGIGRPGEPPPVFP